MTPFKKIVAIVGGAAPALLAIVAFVTTAYNVVTAPTHALTVWQTMIEVLGNFTPLALVVLAFSGACFAVATSDWWLPWLKKRGDVAKSSVATPATGPTPILQNEQLRRSYLLASLDHEWSQHNDNVPPKVVGKTQAPPEWINKRLSEINEAWRYAPARPDKVSRISFVEFAKKAIPNPSTYSVEIGFLLSDLLLGLRQAALDGKLQIDGRLVSEKHDDPWLYTKPLRTILQADLNELELEFNYSWLLDSKNENSWAYKEGFPRWYRDLHLNNETDADGWLAREWPSYKGRWYEEYLKSEKRKAGR